MALLKTFEAILISTTLLYYVNVQVMQSLMFLSRHNVVELKGCVACEIHSHEVLLTELLFMNMFSQFEPAEIAALLSCIVFQQVYVCVYIHV